MKAIHIAVAAALLTTGGAAAAQSATDAKCILVANVFAKQSKDAEAQKLAQATLYFYLGRIGAGATGPQLKSLFDQQAKTLSDTTAGGVMNQCIKDFQGKVELVQSLSPKPPQQPPQGR